MLIVVVHGYTVLAGELAGAERGVSAGGGCSSWRAEGVGRRGLSVGGSIGLLQAW